MRGQSHLAFRIHGLSQKGIQFHHCSCNFLQCHKINELVFTPGRSLPMIACL
jgi:hypothetical protein